MKKLNVKTNCSVLLFLILLATTSIFGSTKEINSLLKKLNSAKDIEKTELLNKLSYNFSQSDFDKSQDYALQALKLSRKIKDKPGEIYALCNLGYAYYLKGRINEARPYFESALTMANANSYSRGKVFSYIGLGLIDWRETKYKSASLNFNKAVAIAEKFKIYDLLGRAYSYSGLIYWKWTDYKKAFQLYFKALSIKEKVGDDFETGVTLNNIAYVYNEMKDFKTSLIYSSRAAEIGKRINNDFVKGRAFSNQGVSYLGLNQFEKALELNKLSLQIKTKNDDKRGIGFSYLDIGDIHFMLKKYGKALSNYYKGYSFMSKTNDEFGKSLSLSKIGNAYLQLNDFEKAKVSYEKSLLLSSRNKFKSVKSQNYFGLSELYKKQGDVSAAFNYYKKYDLLSDSLAEEKNYSKISELQVRYELEKTLSENEKLKSRNQFQKLSIQKNTIYVNALIGITVLLSIIVFAFLGWNRFINASRKELQQKNLEIEESRKNLEEINKSKDKFFSIISHDLRNPFQALLGYTNLLLSDYHNLSDDERKTYIAELDSVFKSTLQLIENLLNWARAQSGKLEYNPIAVNLYQVVTEINLLLLGVAKRKNISLEHSISPDEYVYIDVYFLQTILRNLISNSIKFTKTNGKIKVYLTNINNQKIVVVEDNGIGMTKEVAERLFSDEKAKSTVGTNREQGSGLGLTLCHEFVKKYGGRIWAESEPGKGSRFYFTVPTE
jgi:signal transduction histidine kinase/Tfp pilus assembly protein PilF